MYRREAQLAQLTLSAAKFLTKSSEFLPAARRAMLQALAAEVASAVQAAPQPGGASGRRLLTGSTLGAWAGWVADAGRAPLAPDVPLLPVPALPCARTCPPPPLLPSGPAPQT